jgi:hypothetical protein
MFRPTRTTGFIASALLGLLTATAAETQPTATPATAETTAPAKTAAKALTLDKVEVVSDRLSGAGNVVIQRDDIVRQSQADGDLNKLLQTLPNIQFSDSDGRVTMASIIDLRPSLVSISGGRYYDNNFQIDGLNTNNLQDSSNQNIHSGSEVVAHPQTAVVNPALVESVAVYTSDVPAEFGGFTGGVISAKLRDPSGKIGGGLSLGYESSAMTHYLIADANVAPANPEKPKFERETLSLYADLPLGNRTAALVSWSRNVATLNNTTRFASYGLLEATSRTVSDNFLLKATHRLDDQTTFRFTSMFSPYETENREQDLKTSHNDSWTNKAELTHRTATWSLETSAALLLADNSRGAPDDIYTYKNFGANDLVTWVADSQTVGIRGGVGSLNSSQRDIPVTFKYTLKPTTTGELSLGGDYTQSEARRDRPKDSSAYRHQTTVGVVQNPLVASGDGPNDLTVLTGEQGLNFRIISPAYKSKVQLQALDFWAQWSDHGKILNMPWSYRAGTRYDYTDFLKNHDFAHRLTGSLTPLRWLTFRGGASRYYTRSLLAYKIREADPATSTYTRTGRNENGKLVFYAADWRLTTVSNPVRYASADLRTPYSDELSLGSTLDLGFLGTLDLTGLERRNRDEFSRSASTTIVINGVSQTGFKMTNAGFTNYRSASVEWRKSWSNHVFRLGGTFSKTETTTEEYFDQDTEPTLNPIVSYNGNLVTRTSVSRIRANFARPSYVNYSWSSVWFARRLNVDIFGRWTPPYTRLDQVGTNTITINGTRYDAFADTAIPAGLVTNLNVSWVALKTARGVVTLEAKVTNFLDRLPYAEGATNAAPYQEGRAIWAGIRYAY